MDFRGRKKHAVQDHGFGLFVSAFLSIATNL